MSSPQLPQPFGKYILLNKIAMGGMAEIFRAKTIGAEGFEKEVVIKRILPHYTEDEAFVTMFIDEAKVSSKLTHPNIVQIFDFDSQDECFYISMEYVEGKDLKRVIDVGNKIGKPLTVAQIVHVGIETLKGLHYAHTKQDKGQPQNIVHRDVSPHNVMVGYDGDVKVMDFGIAKAADRSTKTRAGTVKGKCAYMSPEQARGKSLDGRSDMFAVGVMMWEMLTSRRLFAGDSDFETLSNVLRQDAPAPSSINPDVPPELDAILLKCLKKEREERQADCRELARELERWVYSAVTDRHSTDLGAYMQEVFADDLKALREMQREDANVNVAEAHGAVRASRTMSAFSMPVTHTSSSQRAVQTGSRSNVPAANDARTLAIDVGSAGLNSERTVAVDAASMMAGLRAGNAPPKKSPVLWIVLALLLVGGGVGGFFWWQSQQQVAPAAVANGSISPDKPVPTPDGSDGPGSADSRPDSKDPAGAADAGPAVVVPEAPDVAAVPPVPEAPKTAKLTFTAFEVPDAKITANGQSNPGTLTIEAKVGDEIVVKVEHADYETFVKSYPIEPIDSSKQIVLTKKAVVPVIPDGPGLAKLEFTVTPLEATLSVKGQAQVAKAPGSFLVEGYRVGEDVAVEVKAGGFKTVSETLRITSADFKKSYALEKKPIVVAPSGPGKVAFKAKPWAKVMVAGKSCIAPCSMELPSGKYTATFDQGGVIKRAGFSIKPDATVTVFQDMTQ